MNELPPMKRIQAIVRGRVQGVCFRLFTRELANRLGVRGWVRNNSDGSVETVAEGDAQSLREFLDGLRRGPPASRVDDVSHRGSDAGNGFVDFRIV